MGSLGISYFAPDLLNQMELLLTNMRASANVNEPYRPTMPPSQ
jgi:hypothetical protein